MTIWPILLAALLTVSACGGPQLGGREPTPSQYMEMARDELAAGRPLVATAFLADQLKQGDEGARSLLRSNPSVLPALRNSIASETGKLEDLGDALRAKKHIDILRLLTDSPAEADTQFAKLDAELLRRVQSGQIVIDPTASTEEFPSLQRPDIQQIGWQSTIQRLQTNPGNPDRETLLAALRQADRRSPEERAMLLPVLERTDLTRQELKLARSSFPALAERRLAAMSIRVHLETSPRDRLLYEDLRLRLQRRDGLVLVDAGDKPQVRVTVSQLRWDASRLPDRTETVAYRDYEVNLLGALLLMPRNASYMFDRTTGGMELSYAFEITAWNGTAKVGDSLLRDKVSADYVQCSNARIQNVFGGVQRAEFIANDHMQAACSGRKSQPDQDELRRQAISRLADEVMALPVIKNVVGN